MRKKMREKTRESGFSFIEAILAVVIIGIGIVGLMNLFQRTVSQGLVSDRAVQASQLAHERLERIIADKKGRGYDFITMANYPAIESFTGAFAPFTRTLSIQEVRDSDLMTPQPNTGYKRITVVVTAPGGLSVTEETLVTRWNE